MAVQVWDIGGQTIGGKMIKNYIYGAHAVLLTYDISNYQSFQNLDDWYSLVKGCFSLGTSPHVALIANKADLSHVRAVPPEKHNTYADKNGMSSYYVSAKTGDNVYSAFYQIVANIAGVAFSKLEVELARKVISAEIVDYPKVDNSARVTSRTRSSKCLLM